MAKYVLVHGAWHGGWCWKKVAALLRKNGHHVETPDLPGHGQDNTPLKDVTMQAFTDKICNILDAQSEPVILVGHSMAGVVISQVAEYRPNKIRALVYLTAFLLRNNETLGMARDKNRSIFNFSEDKSSVTVKTELLTELFYGDCSLADVAFAKSLLVPENAVIFKTPLQITNSIFGNIPRVYIECLQDKALAPQIQKKLYAAMPCHKVISLNTSHSPFFSAPQLLVEHLIALGNQFRQTAKAKK